MSLQEEARLRELLAPLDLVEPVRLPRRSRRRRRVLVAGFVAAAFAAAGIAIADGVDPFAGIGAADRSQTPDDTLDPHIAESVRRFSEAMAGAGRGYALIPDSVRLLRELPSGRRIYVVATTNGELCVWIVQENAGGGGCGSPLGAAKPTTVGRFDPGHPGDPPAVSFGIARDGVTAVSFMGGGEERTVPVEDNVWAYEGDSSALESLTVHYADGNTRVIAHGRVMP